MKVNPNRIGPAKRLAQYHLAKKFLLELLAADQRSILNVIIFVSRLTTSNAADRLFECDQSLDMSWLLDKEASAESGNMAVFSKRTVFKANKEPNS